MTNTIFNNPSGLDNTDQGNYSTSYDMALLTRYAMKYEEYQKIVKTKIYKLKTNKKSYIWHNKNKLLQYDYVTGGYTEKAKRTLVSTASYNNVDLVVVTIKDSDDWNTHKTLYETTFNQYNAYRVLNKKNFDIIGDTFYKGDFYIKNDVYIPLKDVEGNNLIGKIKLNADKDYKNNEKVGEYQIYLDDKFLYKEDIYIKNVNKKKNKVFSLFKENTL